MKASDLFVSIYLFVMNVMAFHYYRVEGQNPNKRLHPILLFLFTAIGGSLGAALSNYIFNTEHRELRSAYSKFICYLPPVFIFLYLGLLYFLFPENILLQSLEGILSDLMFGYHVLFVIVNTIAFLLVIIRKTSYYIAPIGSFLVPDLIIIPILLLGGATGGCIAKIVFNFKEDWSCTATKTLQNFLYNKGMFIALIIQWGLIIYMRFFVN